jgi:hypothetical protein
MHKLSRPCARRPWRAPSRAIGVVAVQSLMMLVAAGGSAFGDEVPPAPRAPESLLEMSGQMRSLSQQVAPAVVQVLVSGYGLIDSESGTR